jgi:hypothetical protein
MAIPIERIRTLLGLDAEGKTDEQLQGLAEELGNAASTFYDEVQAAWKRDPESVRWMVHASHTGEIEDAESGYDSAEDDTEEARWVNYQKETGDTE